jgi:WD40 repeat protein
LLGKARARKYGRLNEHSGSEFALVFTQCTCIDIPFSHLDAVRALAFHPNELCLATGGDDCTVKIWRMDVASLASSAYVLSKYYLDLQPEY